MHQIPTLKWFSSRLAFSFAYFIEAGCKVENEDVVGAALTGDAPTTSEWSTIWLPTKVRLYQRHDSSSLVMWIVICHENVNFISLRPSDAYIYIYICISKQNIIGSDNGLLPSWRQAIFWTNAGILLTWPSGSNFNEMLIEINTFSLKKIHLKMSSAKMAAILSRTQCVKNRQWISSKLYSSINWT